MSTDGGATFAFDPATSWFRQLLRYTGIIDNQSRSLRKRWLMASFKEGKRQGTMWSIGSVRQDQDATIGYPKKIVQGRLVSVRTDLDAFTTDEIAVLENHGYSVADAALQRNCPMLLADPVPPMKLPHATLMDLERAWNALRWSHRRVPLIGRW